MSHNKLKGFTLTEILIAVALVTILAATTIIAVNPAQHYRDKRNTQRSSDISQISNSIKKYVAAEDHQLKDLGNIPSCAHTPANIGSGQGNIDLAKYLVPKYISALPKDPQKGTDSDTRYTICITDNNRVQIVAPSAEGTSILVQR